MKGYERFLGFCMFGILISIFCDTCIPSYQSDSQNHIRTTRFPSKKQNGMQLPQIGNLIPVFPSQARRFLMLFDGFWLKNSTRMHHEDPWRSMKIHEEWLGSNSYRTAAQHPACTVSTLQVCAVSPTSWKWLVGGHETCLFSNKL